MKYPNTYVKQRHGEIPTLEKYANIQSLLDKLVSLPRYLVLSKYSLRQDRIQKSQTTPTTSISFLSNRRSHSLEMLRISGFFG